ncbi:transmembrane and coiled-coil domain 2 protein Dmtn isoform X2 [Leptinotarsa decemlineata]|uniref:transmembrane and coiled-coil domain 2 protein Dmtn isoform X2 n=1 Tax=Leptinotarsa decemlineata TaxID=7539 RepID=UPI003D309ADB
MASFISIDTFYVHIDLINMVQLTLWNLWRLGAMDSLHVGTQQTGSKTSSRSTSPCRPRESHPYHPHHTKTLSHGSVDSAKSQDGTAHSQKSSKHRSPTSSLNRTVDPEDLNLVSILDDSVNIEFDPSEYPSSFLSNGSSDLKADDDTDSVDPKTNAIIEHLTNKIVRVKDLIRTEQKLRDDNVNEYLKLAANADKQQVQRIKAVFEKKNQKSAQVISQLQKKLDIYQKRVHELETHGSAQSHRPPREVLRDMGQGLKNVGGNIRDGISYVGGSVMSKPREFAHLIKNKFGSADNISQLSRPGATTTGSEGSGAANGGSEKGDKIHHGGSATLPATLHTTTSQSSVRQGHHVAKFPSEEGSECSSVTSDSIGRYARAQETCQHDKFLDVNKKIRLVQDQLDNFRESFDLVKSLQTEIHDLTSSLQEERFRTERLEEQINDLTELHQNEVENLKQAMADMEEKVQYQSEERLRDIHEMLEHCQTKIQKMEHQALQQQQYVTLEGLDNSNARALVVKLINVLLTVLQVILLLVATGAGIIMPFLRTRLRILSTMVIMVGIAFVLRQWPEVQDIGSHVMKRLKDMLDPVQ